MEQEVKLCDQVEKVKLCDQVEKVKEFTYLGDRVSADGGCEADVSARTRYGWATSRTTVSCSKAHFLQR